MDACCGGTTVADGFTNHSHQKTMTANPTSISANGRGRYLVYRDRSRLVKFEEFVKEMMYAILAPEPDSRAGIRKGKSTA